jgi:nucleotide-binding universal stress UspA family protein
MQSILIAVDGSTGSDRAVEEGLELAAATGASVTFVFVRQPPMPILGSPYYQRSVTSELEHAEDALDRARTAAAEHDVPATAEILEGGAAHEIVELAHSRGVDAIVVGSRGLGAMTGVLLGSVSRAVVHDADRPVLVVPAATVRESGAVAAA